MVGGGAGRSRRYHRVPDLSYWRFDGWTLLHSAALGCWIAFLAGCLAGFVFAAALNAISNWGPWANTTNIVILAVGPALTILVLYLLAIPGATQRLGLTGIKAGDVEITLSPSPGIHNEVPSLTPVRESLGSLSGEYTPWFNNIWGMFRELEDPGNKDFMDQAYFQREAAYLEYDPKKSRLPDEAKQLRVPLTSDDEQHNPPVSVAKSVWNQEEFIRSLRPVWGCAGFYHLIFPDVPSIRPLATPILESLLAIETELEAISATREVPPAWINDLRNRLAKLPRKAGLFVVQFRDAIPSVRQNNELSESDPYAPKWEDCTPSALNSDASSSELTLKPLATVYEGAEATIQPPYLAMLIANTYALLGEKDAGLKVLNSWIKYYRDYQKTSEHPQWLYDRAVLEYGNIQEANEPWPTTSEERKYLEIMQTLFLSDWNIDLDNDGYKCDDPEAKAELEADREAKIKTSVAMPSDASVQARLTLLYSSVLQRFLYATIQTLPNLEHDYFTPEHEHWARQLISSAGRCLIGELDYWRDYRQALDLLSGGITLARWAEDGPRSGFLHPSTVLDVQKDAIRALVAALPTIVEREKDSNRKMDGPLRADPSEWETHRRIIDQTVLDLQAKLTK